MSGFIVAQLIFVLLFSASFGALRPRGVSLERKVFYNPSHKFYCLDGSGQLPFHFVNDDFCDCADGSDEPGTAACNNGVFTCLNLGHISQSLPSTFVNDGICDCCDSTDEYNSSAECFNTCKEMNNEALKHARAIREKYSKAEEIRKEYVKLAKERKDEYKKLLEELQKQEQEALKIKNDKLDEKENAESRESQILSQEKEFKKAREKRLAAEKRFLAEQQQKDEEEARKAFALLDLNKDGSLKLDEIKKVKRFDYDNDGTVSDTEAQFYMQKKEEMSLEEFLSSGWRIIKPTFTVFEVDDSHANFEETTDSPLDPGGHSSFLDEEGKDSILKDAETARKGFADADQLYRNIQAEIWHVSSQLSRDYGPDDAFLALESQCFDFTEKRYLYRLCPFHRIVQMQRVNQQETLVGLWEGWKHSDERRYSEMTFTRGDSCWRGPNRSAKISLSCGLENAVLSVLETSPCEYALNFATPAACNELPPHVEDVLRRNYELT